MLSVIDRGPPPPCPETPEPCRARAGRGSHDTRQDRAGGRRSGPRRPLELCAPDPSRGRCGGLVPRKPLPAPQSRILLRIGNSVDFPIVFLGAIAAGHVPVPTSAALTTGEITRIAADLDPALVVAGPGVTPPDHPARVVPLGTCAPRRAMQSSISPRPLPVTRPTSSTRPARPARRAALFTPIARYGRGG
jgi:hypothetical protein